MATRNVGWAPGAPWPAGAPGAGGAGAPWPAGGAGAPWPADGGAGDWATRLTDTRVSATARRARTGTRMGIGPRNYSAPRVADIDARAGEDRRRAASPVAVR